MPTGAPSRIEPVPAQPLKRRTGVRIPAGPIRSPFRQHSISVPKVPIRIAEPFDRHSAHSISHPARCCRLDLAGTLGPLPRSLRGKPPPSVLKPLHGLADDLI